MNDEHPFIGKQSCRRSDYKRMLDRRHVINWNRKTKKTSDWIQKRPKPGLGFRKTMKAKTNHSLRIVAPLASLLLVIVALAVQGCSQKSDVADAKAASDADTDEISAKDRPYVDAARPFAEAVAARDYKKAYGYLSSHAKAQMSPSQFVAPTDDKTEKKNNAAVSVNPTPEEFARLMGATEKEYGQPAKVAELNVFSTDPVALSGKGKSMEEKLDAMFAIGMMPDSIPITIRKASLRSKLAVELSQEQLAESAKAMGMSPEKLKKDPDFDPYITLKIVLVEDTGSLKVGYFEFLPPGLFD
jgi:hypothetical protein